jgi:hypothetical protein
MFDKECRLFTCRQPPLAAGDFPLPMKLRQHIV